MHSIILEHGCDSSCPETRENSPGLYLENRNFLSLHRGWTGVTSPSIDQWRGRISWSGVLWAVY